MKPTPHEKKQWFDFLPGAISKDGFLGNDRRQIHDIVQDDERHLEYLGLNREAIADRLQYFIESGKKGLEKNVDLGDYTVQVRWSRGMQPCPFGERGLHHKLVAYVKHKSSGRELRFTQLNVHMIREHGFFEGSGSTFRMEPEILQVFMT